LLREVIDVMGAKTQFDYDDANNMRLVKHPHGAEERYTHDVICRVMSHHDVRGQVTRPWSRGRMRLTSRACAESRAPLGKMLPASAEWQRLPTKMLPLYAVSRAPLGKMLPVRAESRAPLGKMLPASAESRSCRGKNASGALPDP